MGRFEEIQDTLSEEAALREANRCKNCIAAPCVKGCPAGIRIRDFINRIRFRDYRGAAKIVKDSNVLAAICGRVCPAHGLCVKDCLRDSGLSQPIDIRGLHRFTCDVGQAGPEAKPVRRKDTKVAIIGGGPAGLSASCELRRMGYLPTIFESQREIGGMLTYVIPRYRLPREVLLQEIGLIKEAGVEVRTGCRIDSLGAVQGYSAIFLAVGLWKSKRLGIEGEDLEGAFYALDFLKRVNEDGTVSSIGGRVVVVGGGNTALDAASTVLRLNGVEEVSVVYRRPLDQMPAWGEEIEQAQRDGIAFEPLVSPVRVLGEGGKVKALACQRTRLGSLDSSGRRRVIPIDNSDFHIETDSVIIAIGREADNTFFPNVGRTKDGLIAVDPNMITSIKGVFAGGDIVNGGKTVVEALAEGKRAALAIGRYLS